MNEEIDSDIAPSVERASRSVSRLHHGIAESQTASLDHLRLLFPGPRLRSNHLPVEVTLSDVASRPIKKTTPVVDRVVETVIEIGSESRNPPTIETPASVFKQPPSRSSRVPGKSIGLREVARLAEVSVATVSMVLNSNPRISRATQMRVQQVIDRVGYRPNRLAQSLASQHTRTLAIMLPALRHGFGDAYFGELISGICDRAGKLGYKAMVEQAKPDFIKSGGHLELFERRYVDGVLMLGGNDRHHFLQDFLNRSFPLIVVDNYFTQWNLDYVVCNYRTGAQQVMNCLLQLGHRAIGLITAAAEVSTSRDRQEIYEEKLLKAGITPVATWLADGKFTEKDGAAAAEKILTLHPEVTALFAGNDKMAIGAMHYLHRSGRRVPQDISVIGFDDMRHSAFVVPSLTTVHLPLYEVGATACERLIERIHGRTERVAEILPTHLVLRESTGLARNGSGSELNNGNGGELDQGSVR